MTDGSGIRATIVTAALLALVASSPLADAQGLYRTVGADGRVTYSDHPPASVSPNGRIDVMRAPGGDKRGGVGGEAYPSGRAEPSQGPRQATSAPIGRAPDPAVEAAVIGVLGMEDLVRRTETICVSSHPASARRVSGAVDDWVRRNARTVLSARRILAREFDVEKRERIEEGWRGQNAGRFEAIAGVPDARVAAWCDRSVVEIVSGQMDVYDKPRLTGPLADLPIRSAGPLNR
jgi:hypothetical protein